ncbi:hypothetical protein [Paenibacillus sp. 481]|uniref:hypothetical protein n=1 Tax=Paenibacillus sp. 481 TaxID=2835869 RepID=UPI001E34E17B|nr:hypothetical protein [Paenibacillus sp. 481]UHA72305.1 hypothetical protein KIK04_16670 [Paenibacillus sp. 481]
MAYQGKTDWKFEDTVTEKDLNRIEQGIGAAHHAMDVAAHKPLTLQPGVQIVDAPQDGLFRLGEIKGRTLINLLGSNANQADTWNTPRAICSLKEGLIQVAPNKVDYDVFAENSTIIKAKHGERYLLVANVRSENFKLYLRAINFDKDGNSTAEKIGTPVFSKALKPTFLTFETAPNTEAIAVRIQILNIQDQGTGIPSTATINFKDYRVFKISEAEHNVIKTMTPEQVAERYPYVDSLTNVVNPYAIVTGANLLPPFYEWEFSEPALNNSRIIEPYHLNLNPKTQNEYSRVKVNVLPNTNYTFSAEHNGMLAVDDGVKTLIVGYTSSKTVTFNTGKYHNVFLYVSNGTGGMNTCSFKNPMLHIGDVSKSFQPQQRSMWASESELAANPIDGSEADVLFVGGDGLTYMVEKWRKRTLEAAEWLFVGSKTGYKSVGVSGYAPDATVSGYEESVVATKYNGHLLFRGTVIDLDARADVAYIHSGGLRISVANADSGWGDAYTPSPDEIKAYFMGWTMYNGEAGSGPDVPTANNFYNGTGSKWWVRRVDGVSRDWRDATSITPTALATNWSPYHLQYLKSKPTVEPVKNYETGATLTQGANVVEVGSGIVLREKANPEYYTTDRNWYINNFFVGGKTRFRALEILSVYKSYLKDVKWILGDKNGSIWGAQAVIINANFDPTADYHVTYTILEPTLSAPIFGSVAENLRGTVTDVVQKIGDMERRLGVTETQKVEKGLPEWISATPVNGWVPYNLAHYRTSSYYKDSMGTVRLSGMLSSGSMVAGVGLFTLPVGYRPKYHHIFNVACSDGGATIVSAALSVASDGVVSLTRVPVNGFLSLAGVDFRAEQ